MAAFEEMKSIPYSWLICVNNILANSVSPVLVCIQRSSKVNLKSGIVLQYMCKKASFLMKSTIYVAKRAKRCTRVIRKLTSTNLYCIIIFTANVSKQQRTCQLTKKRVRKTVFRHSVMKKRNSVAPLRDCKIITVKKNEIQCSKLCYYDKT